MAETRETQVLENVVESTEIENPRTTEEAILAKIIAGEEVNINARTRYQAYLKELSSISGGNPNYVETVTGTVANPWGDINISNLIVDISTGNATCQMIADASALGFGNIGLVAYPFEGGGVRFVAIPAAGSSAVDSWFCIAAVYLSGGSLLFASMLRNGSVTDLLSRATYIPAELTIIHHPLPEDNT